MRNSHQHVLGIAIGIIILGVSIKRAKEIVDEGKRERAAIKENSQRTINAMSRAGGIIIERINRGYYDGKTIEDIYADHDFETIVQYNKFE